MGYLRLEIVRKFRVPLRHHQILSHILGEFIPATVSRALSPTVEGQGNSLDLGGSSIPPLVTANMSNTPRVNASEHFNKGRQSPHRSQNQGCDIGASSLNTISLAGESYTLMKDTRNQVVDSI